jgi:type II secretory pathway component PulJ
MPWKKLLAWATGQIDEALRQKLEFVLEENRVYRALLDRHSPHWRLQDTERKALAEKGKPLGQLLPDVLIILQPATLLKWPCGQNTHPSIPRLLQPCEFHHPNTLRET